jgi:hypothetical protein
MAELEETGDPRELVPGDPSAVAENAQVLRARAERAAWAAEGLQAIDTGSWEGPAARAFHDKFSYEPGKWFAAADSLEMGASVVGRYGETLSWAQTQAAEAIHLWDQAEAATRDAQARHDQAAATAAAQNQPAPPFTDPGDAGRQAARDMLARARAQLTESGDTIAEFLRGEAEGAPEESSWLDDLGGFAADVGANVVNGVASVGNAMLNHPGEVAAALGGIGLTVASGAGEGLGLGLSATGAGAVAGVPVSAVSAAGVTAGVGITGAAVASIASNAAGGDRVEPVKTGGNSGRPNKTNRLKEHLSEKDLDAARRELNGEVVARKSSGKPYDHVDEVRNAQDGLVNRINQLKRQLGDSRTTAGERGAIEDELSEASRLLDHSEQFVPRG